MHLFMLSNQRDAWKEARLCGFNLLAGTHKEKTLKEQTFLAVPCQKSSGRILAACFTVGLFLLHSDAIAAQARSAVSPTVPYSVPVKIPAPRKSPPEDPAAPYTPTVVSLIRQLELHNPPTAAELARASILLSTHGGTYDHPKGSNPTCHNLANVDLKTITTPRITPLCFSDGLGINVVSGPNVGETTGLPSMLMLASSFDRVLANAMGQVEGREGRELMVTGLLGPQADTDTFINWQRGHHTPGEDPFLNGAISSAQINGIQGQGLMAQVKHFAVYTGSSEKFTEVQDQALHEILLPPYESSLKDSGASSIMCSYQQFRDASQYLNREVDDLTEPSPFPGGSMKTWRLNETHFACENPLLLTYVLRDLWGSKAFVASDYGAVHSSSGFWQGDDREDPTARYFNGTNPEGMTDRADLGIDSSGSVCANAAGAVASCSEPGASHVAGVPGPGCPVTGCGVANSVANGTIPLAVFNQALARVLYQEERFGFLGCDNTVAKCKNPGGIGLDRSGLAPLPEGRRSGRPQIGTKNGDAAISEKVAEEGGVLLKNDNQTLPITPEDLRKGIAVSGAGAEYLIANPNNEGAAGYADRNAVNPLQQLKALSGENSAFAYTPAGSPTGQPVPCGVLSSLPSSSELPTAAPNAACDDRSGLRRYSGMAMDAMASDRIDKMIDYSSVSPEGQLTGGKMYHWDGWIYIPTVDSYIFRIQYSASIPDSNVAFILDSSRKTLVDATSFYQGQYYGDMSVVVSPTNAGYTEKGLRNRQCAVQQPKSSRSPEPVVRCSESPAVGWHRVALTLDSTGLAKGSKVSFRFAFSRSEGDIVDAAADAEGKALALVFVNDQGRHVVPSKPDISSLDATQIRLIEAVAAANPNTVVVLNTGTPIIVKEWFKNPHAKSVLNMWQAGQEGGTATARLLLGQANPSGHVTITWPMDHTDTIQGYDQAKGLYDGDTAGTHPERLNGSSEKPAVESQGIYSGYRYYDQLGIPVQFPFGYGLSYTTFQFSALKIDAKEDGTVLVAFDLKNTGNVAGAAVPQVYVGPGPAVEGVQQSVRSLRGFERIDLEPGQTKHVEIVLDRRSFEYWSEPSQRWIKNYGPRMIFVGEADALPYLPLSASVTLVDANSSQR
jgi:beta-glucosidase